ncbi:MAG: cation-translocating P-type ATPase [Pirellulales bacterium]
MTDSLATTVSLARPAADRACAYCHLPIAATHVALDQPVYCCLGCRLAAEITGQQGPQGAVHWTLARLGLAIFLSLNVMMFTMALWTYEVHDAESAGAGQLAQTLADLFRYLCLVLSLPVLFLLGVPMLENALADWRRGSADLLIVVGVAAAYVYSGISVLRGAGHVYFEVGCAVLVMVTLGRWLEANGKLKTTEALEALEKLLPDEAHVVDSNGTLRSVPLAELRIGDHIRVLAGQRVPTDALLETGRASIDQQALTGESTPVEREPGDAVLGGSLNLDGELTLRVTARSESSSLARIVQMVRQAREAKGRYQRIADRVAGWFLPVVIVIALGTFIVHANRASLEQGLLAGLAVLLIACPCALGLATPMAVWAALGSASRAGVLFQDGEAVERLATIRAIRFDKTGTLTTGQPVIRRFVVNDEALRGEVLRRASCLAAGSTHVFSHAIADFADAERAGTVPAPAEDNCLRPVVCTSPGQGVLAQFAPDETPTRLGSLRWLERTAHAQGPAVTQAITDALLRGQSFSAIGWNDCMHGVFIFSETLRPGAAQALLDCAALGCDVAVLTGDHSARGRALAQELNVQLSAGLLPPDKVAALVKARAEFGPVAMVGDGINDAPALTASDLGIALGSGVDVSRESASICLVSNDLALVPWSIGLARLTRRVILQNLFWAFSYNTLGIGLAAAGWLNPAWAAAAMVASSLLVVSNSLRLTGLVPPRLGVSEIAVLPQTSAPTPLAMPPVTA